MPQTKRPHAVKKQGARKHRRVLNDTSDDEAPAAAAAEGEPPPELFKHCKSVTSKAAKKAAKRKPARRNKFIDSMAELSGESCGSSDESSGEDEEETEQDRAFLDDSSPVRSRRLPRLRAEEKVVSDDELENLKDECLSLCERKPARKAYADAGDEDKATASDLDFISESEGEGDLERTGKKAQAMLSAWVDKQLRKPPPNAPAKALPADAHKTAKANAFANTMSFLRAKFGGAQPQQQQPVGRVRLTETSRKPAAVFARAAAAKK